MTIEKIANKESSLTCEIVLNALEEKRKANKRIPLLIDKIKTLQTSLEEKMKGIQLVSNEINSKNFENFQSEINSLNEKIKKKLQEVIINQFIINAAEKIYRQFVQENGGRPSTVNHSFNINITYF